MKNTNKLKVTIREELLKIINEADTNKKLSKSDRLNLIINRYKENEKEIEKILGYKIVFLDKF